MAKAANVHHGVHILRHTFCSRLAMSGATTKEIQELAGHQSITTTERYMHLAKGRRGRAIALLNIARCWLQPGNNGRTGPVDAGSGGSGVTSMERATGIEPG